MRKLFLLLFFIFCSLVSFARNDVRVTKITAGSAVVTGDFDNLRFSPQDTIRIFYYVTDADIDPSDITYKAFLNAKITETKSTSAENNFTALTGLDAGHYVFKVQAMNSSGWEANAFILQFSIDDALKISETNPGNINTMDGSSIELNSFILYGLAAITFAQLIIIALLVVRKRNSTQSAVGSRQSSVGSRQSSVGSRQSTVSSLQSTVGNRQSAGSHQQKFSFEEEYAGKKNNELVAELKDLHLSYNILKKDLDAMKDTNNFLRNQISSLQLNVKNLEEANLNLAVQKDRLLEGKRQLQELQTQKDELFAMAVHDIKNPAAAIRSYVELLESYDLNANDQQQIMQSLVDTSSRIVNLAQQMSVIIAKQAPEPALSLEPVSIKGLIDSICNRNYAYAKRKNIKLINNSSPHIPKTLLDIGKMEEVIDNLINNAIKFAPEETIVQIRTFFSDTKITVEVEDNGVGLSDEDIKRAFEKGARLSAQPTGGETSSGLGLWIVKNVIEEHGGGVWVKSKPGMGSTFAFELPIKSETQITRINAN